MKSASSRAALSLLLAGSALLPCLASSAPPEKGSLARFKGKYRLGMEIEVGYPHLNVIVDDFDFNAVEPRPDARKIAETVANAEWLAGTKRTKGVMEFRPEFPLLNQFVGGYLKRHGDQGRTPAELEELRKLWIEYRAPRVQIPEDLNRLGRTERSFLVIFDVVLGADLPLKADLLPRRRQVYENLGKSRDQGALEFRHREDFVETDPDAYLKTVRRFFDRVLRPEGFGVERDPPRPEWDKRRIPYHVHISATDGRDLETAAREINLVTQLELYKALGAQSFGPSHALVAYNDVRQKGLIRLFERNRIELRTKLMAPDLELERALGWLDDPASLKSALKQAVRGGFVLGPKAFLRQMFTRSDERAFYFVRDFKATEGVHGMDLARPFGELLPELMLAPTPAIQDAAAMAATLYLDQAAVRRELLRSVEGWPPERIHAVFSKAFEHVGPYQRKVALTAMVGEGSEGLREWGFRYLEGDPTLARAMRGELRAIGRRGGAAAKRLGEILSRLRPAGPGCLGNLKNQVL